LALLGVTNGVPLDQALFEAASAFSTAGITVGLTAKLPISGQIVTIALMYIGRVGPIAVAAAIALNTRHRLYRYPEERPIVG
jgi:Trk-type K+ transport system membrane component